MLKQQEPQASNKLSTTFTLNIPTNHTHLAHVGMPTADSIRKVPTLGTEHPENHILSEATEPWSSLESERLIWPERDLKDFTRICDKYASMIKFYSISRRKCSVWEANGVHNYFAWDFPYSWYQS